MDEFGLGVRIRLAVLLEAARERALQGGVFLRDFRVCP
jgi:hypothetical protein